MVSLQSSVPHPLHSRTQAGCEQPYPARKRQWWKPGVALRHTSLPLDFTGESKSPGQACPEGAEVTTHLQGWTGTILTIHNLSHQEVSHPGHLVHHSCFTGVGKRAQRHEAICLRSHSSPWKTSSVGAGPRRDRPELDLARSF